MRRIDRRIMANDIINRTKEHLGRVTAGSLQVHPEVQAAWTTIAALPPDVDLAVIDNMYFGHTTWVLCDLCFDLVAAVVELGDGDEPYRACRNCLIAALDLLPEPREVKP